MTTPDGMPEDPHPVDDLMERLRLNQDCAEALRSVQRLYKFRPLPGDPKGLEIKPDDHDDAA